MKPRGRSGGLAAWSIRHPVGVSMLALALIVLGVTSLARLSVDLLPQLIYPEVRVRILDPGVPARIMEDRVTRQLEEQLAITEGAIAVQSESSEGTSSVDLSFRYGTDIDQALRDASTRLDRAKRFLPDTIQPPVIYKRDPSQIPVAEFVVSSSERGSVALRDWVDYDFSTRFLNLPGVAAVEIGGGLQREIRILPDPERLAAVGLTLEQLAEVLRRHNVELAAGRLTMPRQELSSRTDARLREVSTISRLPVGLKDGTTVRLEELARVEDGHAEERIRVRLDGVPGVKVSIQKQPAANTVAVVDAVNGQLAALKAEGLLPEDVMVRTVADQSVYVRHALSNATMAALSGSLLAMAVVYLFLGDLRRTLIIGSAIPIAVMVTFALMGAGGLTFNIMTLGGLALGVGMLVDNTIVMLENIYRHQREGEGGLEAGTHAAAEINSAIVASTSTNLAAVLPFLFVGGLIGLLFRELIFTISAAILASMVVALTLVPALAVRVRVRPQTRPTLIDRAVGQLQQLYSRGVERLLGSRWLQGAVVVALVALLGASLPVFLSGKQSFLPEMDNGEVRVSITADPGVSLDVMDRAVQRVESLLHQQPEVQSVFTLAGGFIFGRTEREMSSRSTLTVQLVPRSERTLGIGPWIKRFQKLAAQEQLAGIQIRVRSRGIRGIRIGRGDDDVSLRIQGPNLETLADLADEVVARLKPIEGLRNVLHSAEEQRQELVIVPDRIRLADLGIDPAGLAAGVHAALTGLVVTDLQQNDRAYPIRLEIDPRFLDSPRDLEQLPIVGPGGAVYRLGDMATIRLDAAPAEIRRDAQRRIVEISASLAEGTTLGGAYHRVGAALTDLELPPGYRLYDGGALEQLQASEGAGRTLLALALFLVFVVMAVQYESLRNPLVILLSVPFAAIGVAAGLTVTGMSLTMPVWLGLIMLAGIVVNNAIVLVEYAEIAREKGAGAVAAVIEAARLRLRPILMTTLTTVAGMLPLALGIGEGAEMLQPLAVTLVSGLVFALLVSLVLIPILYTAVNRTAA